MKHLSLFTGVGAFDLGFDLAGWACVGQVEIDEKCREVLTRHWPEVPKYADIRDLDGREFADVDCITGGFPCQDLSVAGRRAGLAGARSGLWWEMHRIIAEARPRFVVWENVPGLLSADDGGAMGAVLHSLADLGYYGAWRVLDSQYFGVAQRRRRVFGVFAEGRAGGKRCAEVLLEPEGGGWAPAPREGAGEAVAYSLDSGAGGDSGKEQQRTFVPDVSYPLTVGTSADRCDESRQTYVPDVSLAVQAQWRKGVTQREGQTTLVAAPLEASDGHHGYSSPRGDGADNLVAYALRGDPGGVGQAHNTNYVSTLQGSGGRGWRNGAEDAAGGHYQPDTLGVRRLTPTECERLQGFPDGWTEGHSDAARYAMMGNAVTVNVAYWLALRLRPNP